MNGDPTDLADDAADDAADDDEARARDYPGARRPDRREDVDVWGVRLSRVEWGDPADPPLLLAHGGFDFAETFDVFAPFLTAAGWRVVSWDHRGHGCSAWADLYSWEAELRDFAAILETCGPDPVPVVGHSKGGALSVHLAEAMPHRFSHLVNLDGLPSRRNMPDIAEHERTRMLAREVEGWLDWRRTVADYTRKSGTIDDLARRRGRMNNRLSHEWLRYLVTVGGSRHADGWRWRIDPTLRMGGFGPWRPEWSMLRLPAVTAPFLAVFATELEVMGWGTRPDDVAGFLPAGAEVVEMDGAGHFLHIEQPVAVAELVLDFVGRPR